MANQTWKNCERRFAKKLGGRRIPVTGERDGIDIDAGPFVYQLKVRKGMPSYLDKWLDGIVGQAAMRDWETGQSVHTGVVIWKPPGDLDDDAVVVLRFKDWRDLHGGE